MAIDRVLLRDVVRKLDEGGEPSVDGVVAELRALGAVNGIHVGRTQLSPDETVEWYAGQGLAILEDGALFAVNSWINCADKFVPVSDG